MVIQHFECTHVTILERNKLKLNSFPELNNSIDLFVHLSLIFGDLAYLLNSVLVVEQSQEPKKFQL